jgi:hypothetical protein
LIAEQDETPVPRSLRAAVGAFFLLDFLRAKPSNQDVTKEVAPRLGSPLDDQQRTVTR